MNTFNPKIKNLLNENGQIIRWPKKPPDKSMVIDYLGSKFDYHRTYSEKEVNAIIITYHIFEDTTLLRRELVSRKLLSRQDDGSEYWKV
tara:strand:+ start:430 stop:696 length:267 start_codon:yes stop_codon:yes gene_type:complete